MNAFNKKISENSMNSIKALANDVETLQKTLEHHKLVKKYINPQLSQRSQFRSQTPCLKPNLLPTNNNCLKQIVRISNSRLCSSRAGHIESNSKMPTDVEKKINPKQWYKKNQEFSKNLYQNNEAIERNSPYFIKNPLIKSLENKSYGNLSSNGKKKTESQFSKLISPELAAFLKSLEFKKIKSDKTVALLKKVKEKFIVSKISG